MHLIGKLILRGFFKTMIKVNLSTIFDLRVIAENKRTYENTLTPTLSVWPLRGHRVLKSILGDILQPTKS